METPQSVASDFLSRILHDKRAEILARKAQTPEDQLADQAAARHPAMVVLDALRGENLRVIAEVKRGSPSAGTFNAGLDAAEQARLYAEGGAAAVSVLTDGPYFQGSLADLSAARQLVEVPLLCKDFVIDPYQVYEARAAGADMVLLIAAAVDAETLAGLMVLCERLGMTPLVEVNTKAEAHVAADLHARLVGINNRNLHTFVVDMGTTARLRPLLSLETVVVSLSGIKTAADAQHMRKAMVDAVLVGEALVRAERPTELLTMLSAIR